MLVWAQANIQHPLSLCIPGCGSQFGPNPNTWNTGTTRIAPRGEGEGLEHSLACPGLGSGLDPALRSPISH